jgi:Uma2 family endonuclease
MISIKETHDSTETIGGKVVTRPGNTLNESLATVFLILRLVDKSPKTWCFGGNARVRVGPNILHPDIMAWRDDLDINLQQEPIERTPDFVCEITAGTRVDVDFYRPYVPYLWVLDVEKKRLTAHDFRRGTLFETSLLEVPYVLAPFDFALKFSELVRR